MPLGCTLQGIKLQWVLMDAMLGSSVTLAQLAFPVCHYVKDCSWTAIFDICFVCLGKHVFISLWPFRFILGEYLVSSGPGRG